MHPLTTAVIMLCYH